MTPAIALATYFALAVLLFGLLAGSSRGLDASAQAHMRRWIYRSTDEPDARDQQWAESFVQWFDHVFRVKTRELPGLGAVALPSFWRSVLVSFVGLLVLALVWVSNKPGLARIMEHGEVTGGMQEMFWRLLLVYGGATLITNWLPDYLSLIESRLIIGKMARASSWGRRFAWLGLDAAATLAISFFSIHLGMVLLLPIVTPALEIEVGCLTPDTYSLATTWELFCAGLRFESPAGTLNYDATGIYIYSTFLTSLWVWFYLAGGFVLRAIYASRARLAAPEPPTARDARRPLRAMGVLFVLSFSAVFWPSWFARQANSADVYIIHVEADTQAARELAAELEAGGLHVRLHADLDEARAEALLARAGAVLVLDSPATVDGQLDTLAAELYLMGECGERAWGSSANVSMQETFDDWSYDPPQRTDRYGWSMGWRPGQDAGEVLRWAQRADAVIHPGQVRACQHPGMPHRQPAPNICELR